MGEKIINDYTWKINFIRTVCAIKSRIFRTLDVIITKRGFAFDDVLMIETFEMLDGEKYYRCKEDEVVLSINFPGYDEEICIISYVELLELLKSYMLNNIDEFEEEEKIILGKKFKYAKGLLDV